MPRRSRTKTLRSSAASTTTHAATVERLCTSLRLAARHLEEGREEATTALMLIRAVEAELSALHVEAGVEVSEAALATLKTPRRAKKGSRTK